MTDILPPKMNAERDLIFKVQGQAVAFLSAKDPGDLQGLLERAADYYLLVCGESPAPGAAQRLMADLPPGKTLDDKLVMGVFGDQGLIGVMDVVRDYPERGVWWIGLLLLDPVTRGQGLGEALYRSFEPWAGQLGAQAIGLGVVEKNVRAVHFWKRLGFIALDKKPQTVGRLDQVVLRMWRQIPGY